MHCKKCNASMNEPIAHPLIDQIGHRYQLQEMAPKIVEDLTKCRGPMCDKCLVD
jgi:hypothetical protein